MEAFVELWRRRLAIHGAFIFVVALAVGAIFGMVQDSGTAPPEQLRRWQISHNQGLAHTFLLFGLAAAVPYFRLNRQLLRLAGWSVLLGAWAAVSASVVSASFNVLGRSWNPDGWNRVAFILFALGVFGSSFAFIVITLRAAWEALREGIAPRTWRNWARTVSARPRRVPEPGSLQELIGLVQQAIDQRMPVRAFGSRASWNAMAVSHGMMIDMSRLADVQHFAPSDPMDPAVKGRVRVEAGIEIGELSESLSQQEPPHTLETATVIPWVRVGGALAMGCHGTGTGHPQFSDLVVQIQLIRDVNGVATLETYDRPPVTAPQGQINRWNALLVNLGALGVMYTVTFECVKMFNVRLEDSRLDMAATINNGLPGLLADPDHYVEIFWFPYSDQCWLKTWKPTNAPLQGIPANYWRMQWVRNKILAPVILQLLAIFPYLTPLMMRLFGALVPTLDRVVELPTALHYQRHFTKALDMGYAIPYDHTPNGMERVKKAWFAVVDRLDALRHSAIYPQNLVLHTRFVGPGNALLAPSNENDFTCYIEILTGDGTPRYEEYFEVIEREWLRLGGRPHWAKLTFHPERIRDLYPKADMDEFLKVRKEFDPKCIFLNDYLCEILGVEEN